MKDCCGLLPPGSNNCFVSLASSSVARNTKEAEEGKVGDTCEENLHVEKTFLVRNYGCSFARKVERRISNFVRHCNRRMFWSKLDSYCKTKLRTPKSSCRIGLPVKLFLFNCSYSFRQHYGV